MNNEFLSNKKLIIQNTHWAKKFKKRMDISKKNHYLPKKKINKSLLLKIEEKC